MDLSAVADFFRQFETQRVLAWLQGIQLNELVQNRYFLGGTAVVALIALVMRWRLLLSTLIGVVGFVALLSYTLSHGTSLDGGLENSSLMVFVGGGAVIVGLVIYLLFIRTE